MNKQEYFEDIKNLYLNGETATNISNKYNISVGTVCKILESQGIKRRGSRQHTVDFNFFKTYSPESCYWAGFIAADGGICKNTIMIGLQKKDKDHLEKFKIAIKCSYNVNERKKGCNIYICSKEIVGDLNKFFNIYPNKSLTISFPKNLPENMKKYFIRGYFDGDGTVSMCEDNVMRFSIVSGSEKQIDDLKENIEKLINITCYKHTYKNYFYLMLGGKNAFNLISWLYDENEELVLNRKFERFKNYKMKFLEHRKRIMEKENNLKVEEESVIKYIKQGLFSFEICELLNISAGRFYYIIKKNNLKSNRFGTQENLFYKEVIKLYNENKSTKEISNILNVSSNLISNILLKFGISIDKNRKEFIFKRNLEIVEFKNQGATDYEICEKFKISRRTCRRVFEKKLD